MNIIPPQKDSSLVLVVDDDNFMRIQLRRAMEQAGYQVVETSDGEQALTAYTHLNPDIVLLDALMPVMDGFTCCTKLQTLPGGKNIPILMITALEDQESVDRAFDAGATDYITKPIHWAVLRQRVRRMLQASRATKELRQQTEQTKLREEQLRLALDAAHMGTWDWDIISGKKVTYSPQTALNFGLTPDTFDGTYERFLKSIHPEDRELVTQAIHDALEKKADYNIEFRVVWSDNSIHWLASRGQVYYETDKPVRMIGVNTDITARKQADEILRESEARFRTMADSAPVFLWMSDTDALCTFFNKSWLEFTGRTLEQEVGNGWLAVVHPEDYQHCLDIYLSAFNARQNFRMEYRLLRADGEYRWLLDTGVPRFTSSGSFAGYIGSCIDISDRKRAEEVLQESNQRVINIFESITDAFFALDKEWKFTYLNRQAEQLLQRTRAELLGKSVWDEFPEATASAFYREYHRAVAANVSVEFEELYPSLNTWFEVHAYPSQDGLSVYFQNINERKQAEIALRESEQRLKLALQTAKLGSWQLDLQTGELSLSHQCKADFGLPPGVELSYDALFELIHPEDRAYARKSISQALEQKTDYEAEYRIIWEDGSVHWILTRGRGIYQANGNPTRIIGSTLR